MRLLEFGRDESSANPLSAGKLPPPPVPAEQTKQTKQTAVPRSIRQSVNKPVPLKAVDNIKIKQAGRKPVELGQLKQRIDSLERRMRAQSEKLDNMASTEKLDLLKQRILRLEQCLGNELGTARQREDTLLKMLHQTPFTQQLKRRLTRFWRQDLPAAANWLRQAMQVWWRDSQPCWWPQFVGAWQTSLEQARNGASRHQ